MQANDLNLSIHSPILIYSFLALYGLMTVTLLVYVQSKFRHAAKVLQALQAGATGYLLKRTEPQRILESIKELSQGGSPMSSNIARKVLNIFLHEKINYICNHYYMYMV